MLDVGYVPWEWFDAPRASTLCVSWLGQVWRLCMLRRNKKMAILALVKLAGWLMFVIFWTVRSNGLWFIVPPCGEKNCNYS